jgi:hypothetical protein
MDPQVPHVSPFVRDMGIQPGTCPTRPPNASMPAQVPEGTPENSPLVHRRVSNSTTQRAGGTPERRA